MSKSRGVSMPFAAMTYIVALTQPLSRLGQLVLVRDEVDPTDAIILDQNLAGDRTVDQPRAAVGRVVQCNGRIIFGLDRANRNATGIAGAGAAILDRVGNFAPPARLRTVSEVTGAAVPRNSRDLVSSSVKVRKRLVHVLVEKRRWDPRHRIGVAGGKRHAGETVVRHVAGNAELGFRFLVPLASAFRS